MPDDDYEEEGSDEKSPAWYRKQMKAINDELAEAKAAAATNQDAARRVAFQDANIPDTPQTKFFRQHYDGEWTPDAIKAAATEFGFVAPVTTDPATESAVAGAQAFSEAAAGGFTPAPGNQAEIEREMDEAVSHAPHGQEAKAIAEVWKRYNKNPVDA